MSRVRLPANPFDGLLAAHRAMLRATERASATSAEPPVARAVRPRLGALPDSAMLCMVCDERVADCRCPERGESR